MAQAVVCVLIYIALLSAPLIFSWNVEGYQAIGMTAMSAIHGTALTQVKRLLGGKDVVDVADWSTRVAAKFPETAPLHFLYQPNKGVCDQLYIDETNCPENQCIVRAVQHLYGRLTGKPKLIPLTYPHGLQLTDSDAVKFLVNLIGDLHQPLHLGFKDDLGGKNISVVFIDAQGDQRPTNLFQFWEGDLIEKFMKESPSFWFGGWTHAHSLGSKLAELRQQWEDEPSETRHVLFEKWALESLAKACSSVYHDPRSGEAVPDGMEVKSSYEYIAFEVVKSQILVAGERVALVLNSILKERDAVKLRQGSGIEVACK